MQNPPDMLFFFAVIVVGFIYLWRFGYLDWVRVVGGRLDEGKVGATRQAPAPGAVR